VVVNEDRDEYQIVDVPTKIRYFGSKNVKLQRYCINADLGMLLDYKVVYFYYAIDKNRNQLHIESLLSKYNKVRYYYQNNKECKMERWIDGVIEFDKLMNNFNNFISRFMRNTDENKLLSLKRDFLMIYLDQIDELMSGNKKTNHIGLIRELHIIFNTLCANEKIYEISFKKVIKNLKIFVLFCYKFQVRFNILNKLFCIE
jgi:hypothetical protein